MVVYETKTMYRGFLIGYVKENEGYLAATVSSMESNWMIWNMHKSTLKDTVDWGRRCVDFQYLCDTEEIILNRQLTPEEISTIRL
jgi:hypothetical protein